MAAARRWLSAFTLFALVALGSLAAVVATPAPAQAADLSGFDPGNIISDEVLFDGNDLTAAQVQDFLDSKGASCKAGSAPCLKDYTETTTSRSGDDRCGPYTGRRNETAAQIITNVARSCGISARALIVMLQKEQGLVTASGSGLTNRRYEIAMGYGCPDTAPCASEYYGFYNQVYRAARQLESYRLYPTRYSHRAGITNSVRYHPNASCGSSKVFIENTATAALYNYTPYQPNSAALRAGYGRGDSCSSYGNRNFYAYFADWFGTPSYTVRGAIAKYYYSRDNAEILGKPTANERTVGNGYMQTFENGTFYLNSKGAWKVLGPIGKTYTARGGPTGALGWPSGEDECPSKYACYQEFDDGIIYTEWSAGTHAVIGDIADFYLAQGGSSSTLGFPTGERARANGAWVQQFQGGRIFASSAGTAAVRGYFNTWYSRGNNAARLGNPAANEVATSYGVYQRFANGSVHLTPTSATMVMGPISRTYEKQGGGKGWLGRPLAEAECQPTSCVQQFDNGRIYTAHGAGTWAVSEQASAAIDDVGISLIGFPTSAEKSAGGAKVQAFQRAEIYTVNSRASVLRGYLKTWHGGQSDRRDLGAPTSNEGAIGKGIAQNFVNGSAYLVPSGSVIPVYSAIRDAYLEIEGPRGPLGWPTGQESCSGGTCSQQFQGGRIYRRGSDAVVLRGAMLATWNRSGNAARFGLPRTDEVTTDDGVYQRFANGTMFLNPRSYSTTMGPIDRAYWAGSNASEVGWPQDAAECPASNWCYQDFSNGTFYTAHGAGTWPVIDPMDSYLRVRGGVTGSGLGFPTGPRTPQSGGGYTQTFQNGTLVEDATGNVGLG